MDNNLDDFLTGYALAMAWANVFATDADGQMVDSIDAYAVRDPDDTWVIEADGYDPAPLDLTDAIDFYRWNLSHMFATGQTDFGQHGHDFALTRNGHGAGFWDRGYGDVGHILTDAAKAYGEATIILDIITEG